MRNLTFTNSVMPSFRGLTAKSSVINRRSLQATTLDSAVKPRNDILIITRLCIVILLTLSLTSCFHTRKKDGPPNFYVDETKVPNAVPKVEPRAKYGNMASYRVFGHRYYIMKSGKNYNQVGTASWYGTQFHEQRTSSGEPYNMLAMTAAHRTLPLPTYVEVTNLKNNRRIIVKVNDRGPFASNRIIDLSYVAAKKLGMLGRGTTFVRVKAIDPTNDDQHRFFASNDATAPKRKTSYQNVYLQVGAFKSRVNAQKFKDRLDSLLTAPINISNASSNLYHVQVGPINDVATENRIANRLRVLGIKPNKRYGA